ncbi:Flp pilus assembly protein TadD, contains TPR repeats [Formivibrio citricus]|uniref:Flp pilus assembly protein TadD, contains TPR repeats n=1 Tax=Formivibrio citricus TaxID=83765 RepID=A0A1I5DER8_9NEIS|nr:tetratricopeptide repeat protein [Formivibrio citricus]SFN97682.1 Flp pilus assembly protein TadD, contains TPR repeats [Formivibrio citricus]
MRSRLFLLIPLSLLFSACASLQQAPDESAEMAVVEQQEVVREEGWRPEELPKTELSADLLIRFLVGDVALQRGQPALAARTWLDLARRTKDPRIARRALEMAVATGQVAQAQELSKIWSDAAPSSGVARQLALSLAIRANKLDEAEALIDPFLKNPPPDLAGFYMQLHLLWDRGADPKAVIRLTEKLTAGKDSMPEARFARAVAHAMQAREATALAELEAALDSRAWWEPAVLYRAQLLTQGKKPDQAIIFLQQAVEKKPGLLSFRLALARTLADAKRETEARAVYEEILAITPDNLESLVSAGLLALQNHEIDAAYRFLSAAVKQEPRNANLLRLYLGQIEEERYRFREAQGWYGQVTGEEMPKAEMRLPRVLARLGEREAALKALEKLPQASEEEKIAKIQMEAQVWRDLKLPAKGREILTLALKQHPDSVDLLYDRALLADLEGDIAAAETDLRRALGIQPDSVQVLNALGYVLVSRTDRLADAEPLLLKAIAAEPDNPVIIDSVGWLRFRQGKLEEALDWLARAYAKVRDPEVAAHYAEVLWTSGNKNKAREVFATGQKLDPEHPAIVDVSRRLGL